MNQNVKRVAGPIGVGAVACAAWCAGPILGVLGGIGVAGSGIGLGLGATLLAVVLATATVAGLLVHRTRQSRASGACPPAGAPEQPVAAPRWQPDSHGRTPAEFTPVERAVDVCG